MSWRSIVITKPSHLNMEQGSLQINQKEHNESVVAKVPLEDISVILIENFAVTLSAKLLSACADKQILVITVDDKHHPNGMFLPYLPHSRALKIMRAQLDISLVKKKKIWRDIIQKKIENQAAVLYLLQDFTGAARLKTLARSVRPGDANNVEAIASQIYFPAIWGQRFFRSNNCFVNAALNYGYAIIRAAIARSLCSYGFLPAFGIFHHSELNAFNLADDIIEPYRPFIDLHVVKKYTQNYNPLNQFSLTTQDKTELVSLLHQDVRLTHHVGDRGVCTLLVGIDATIISLSQCVLSKKSDIFNLVMPCLSSLTNE